MYPNDLTSRPSLPLLPIVDLYSQDNISRASSFQTSDLQLQRRSHHYLPVDLPCSTQYVFMYFFFSVRCYSVRCYDTVIINKNATTGHRLTVIVVFIAICPYGCPGCRHRLHRLCRRLTLWLPRLSSSLSSVPEAALAAQECRHCLRCHLSVWLLRSSSSSLWSLSPSDLVASQLLLLLSVPEVALAAQKRCRHPILWPPMLLLSSVPAAALAAQECRCRCLHCRLSLWLPRLLLSPVPAAALAAQECCRCHLCRHPSLWHVVVVAVYPCGFPGHRCHQSLQQPWQPRNVVVIGGGVIVALVIAWSSWSSHWCWLVSGGVSISHEWSPCVVMIDIEVPGMLTQHESTLCSWLEKVSEFTGMDDHDDSPYPYNVTGPNRRWTTAKANQTLVIRTYLGSSTVMRTIGSPIVRWWARSYCHS